VVLFPSDEILEVLRGAHPPATVKLQPVIRGQPGHPAAPVPASAVLTSSGTMSMHCALAGIPGAIAYRASPLTYYIGRLLLNVEYLGIANLLLGEPMYPEFIQHAATPDALAAELRRCVFDPARREKTAAQAARLRTLLEVPAAGTAADWLARAMAPAGPGDSAAAAQNTG
jgi:lipid-A-disaccharide synthase